MPSLRRVARTAALAPLIALAACGGGGESPTGTAVSHVSLFEAVWADFDRNYAFFEHGGIDWPAMRAAYRDSVAAAGSDAETARLIGAMLGRLADYHADLTTSYGVYGPPPIPHPHHFDPALVRGSYLAQGIRPTRSGKIYWGRLEGGVGYVHIGSFAGEGWGDEIEEALRGLAPLAGLVIDIRDNLGGNEQVARDVAVRLYDRSRVYRATRFRDGPGHGDFTATVTTSLAPAGAVRFAGPVALVTNRFNGSAAEDFVLMLRALPQVATVGDTTLGLGSNPLERTLANGWRYRVPRSMQSTPDGFVYQWRGLPPTVPVAWSAADTAAGRDPYLDEAIRRVTGR